MRTRPTVALVAVLLAASACTGDGDTTSAPAGPMSASSSAPAPRTTLAPIRFGAERLWSGKAGDGASFAMEQVEGFKLVGDALIYVGRGVRGHNGRARLTVADAASGKTRWSVDETAALGGDGATVEWIGHPIVVNEGGDWTVLVTYERPVGPPAGARAVEQGIAALAGKNGRFRWKIPALTAPRPARGPWASATLWTAHGTLAVVGVSTLDRGSTIAERTIAFDIPTRRRLWDAPGTYPAGGVMGIAGRNVLVEQNRLPYKDISTVDSAVVALDAATGTKRWDLSKRHKKSRLRYSTSDTTVVAVEDGTVVLDARTGRELARLRKDVWGCHHDGRAIIACQAQSSPASTRPIVVLRRVGDTATATVLPKTAGLDPGEVWKGRVFASRGDGLYHVNVMMDGAGTTLATGLPGQLGAIDDAFAVFYTGPLHGGGDFTFAVYRVLD